MKTIILLTFLMYCLALTASGQKGVVLKETSDEGTATFIRIDKDSLPLQISQSQKALKEFLKLTNNDEMRLISTTSDSLGFTHQYFQQYFRGVRVEYGVYAVHGKNNFIETLNGIFKKIEENVEIRPSLNESEALNYALKEIDANLYKWQIPTEEKWISDNFGTTYYPKGNLVIILDKYNTGAYKLAWKFDIYAHKPVSRNYIFVDAISGIIIKKTSRLHNSNANGTASTRYSGSRSIVTDSYAGGFRLKETRNSVRIETYNMHQDTVFGSASLFQDDNNNWTAAEYHNANKDDAALDAHWGTEKVYDYFYIVHNRNSYNGSGGPLLSFVHVNIEAYPFFYDNNNAYWDGQRMIYADGDGVNYDPFTSLDISAHELAHGICDFTARFDYENESGAINEGFSDIWAACVERYAAPEKQTWLIGEDNAIPPNGHPGRSMSNPNTYNQPDTYGGTYWVQTGCSPFPAPSNDFCGVHTNSGVLNFWFFLLSDGGSGTNDLNHSYNVWPIGINKASRIAYRAETVIIPPPTYPGESSTTFSQLRTATISAATDLYGRIHARSGPLQMHGMLLE